MRDCYKVVIDVDVYGMESPNPPADMPGRHFKVSGRFGSAITFKVCPGLKVRVQQVLMANCAMRLDEGLTRK